MKKWIYLTIMICCSLADHALARKNIDVEHYIISPPHNYYYISLIPREQLGVLGDPCADTVNTATFYYNAEAEELNALMFCASTEGGTSSAWIYLPDIWLLEKQASAYDPAFWRNTVTFEHDVDRIPFLGIGTEDPAFHLSLIGDGGILAKGSERSPESIALDPPFYNLFQIKNNLASLHAVPSGKPYGFPLFWWYAQKGAFRAQYMRVDDSIPDYDALWDQNAAHTYQNRDGNIGYYSTAIGDSNIAAGRASFVGGSHNAAWDHSSSIISGYQNRIQTTVRDPGNSGLLQQRFGSVIGGGDSNVISGPHNLILGGRYNSITHANNCAIGGGWDNHITDYSPESPTYDEDLLEQDTEDGTHSIILGGLSNNNYGRHCAIGGGYQNTIEDGVWYSGIIGGVRHVIESNTSHSVMMGASLPVPAGPPDATSDPREENNILGGSYSALLSYGYGPQDSGENPVSVSSNHSLLLCPGEEFVNGIESGDSDYIVSLGAANSFWGHHSVALTNHFPPNPGDCPEVQVTVNADYATVLGGGISARILSGSNYAVAANAGPHISMENAMCSFATDTGSDNGVSMKGDFSVSHGNKSTGDHSYTFTRFPGGCDEYQNNADRSFLWGVCPPSDLDDDNRFIIYAKYDHDGFFWTDDLEIRVGINTTDPQKTLHVNGSFQTAGLQIQDANLPSGSKDDLFRENSTGQVYRNDIAEIFPSHEPVELGDLVAVNPSRPKKLRKSSGANDPFVIGVASSMPAAAFEGHSVVLAPKISSDEATVRPHVALAGRVLIKVCLENGPIRRGDLLTPSSIAGVAMKAENTVESRNAVIGKALEDFAGPAQQEGTVIGLVMVR